MGVADVDGVRGAAGVMGAAGVRGARGVMGVEDVAGARGAAGAGRAVGVMGAMGMGGDAGARGVSGVMGMRRVRGVGGVRGVAGVAGVGGVRGMGGVRGIRRVAGVVLGAALLAGPWVSGWAQTAPVETITVGVSQPVEILHDRWGIAHIYAQNEHDLFFAQGYNVAHDRLFQLEMWRRQATGTAAEILGHSELERDIGNRLFQYRGNLDEELQWYHPHGAAIVQAFVDGINAYIAQTQAHPELLTPEFRYLGIQPQPWTAAVVISRFNALSANVTTEIGTAQAVHALGAARVEELEHFQPAGPDLSVDAAIDTTLLSREILAPYTAYHSPMRFTAGELAAGAPATALARLNASADELPSEFDLAQTPGVIGSNNWVVSGRLTVSGFPMMMNDPHRVQEAPSLRYWVHLVAPGWDVIGAGEPALPGISVGHNQRGAWGLTIFGSDEEDLYVYDTNPAAPNQYRYQGAWVPMRIVETTIPVKGEAPVTVQLKYTRHGPVVYEDAAHHKAYAVRAAWLEPGGAPYLASLRMDQAQTWTEFEQACTFARMPGENMVWADVDGNIGFQAIGITPMRPNWSGLVPVPGDGRYEWSGYLDPRLLPHTLNPAAGFFNTSNNYDLPPNWPYKTALHYQWGDAYRAARVAEVLGSGRLFTVADMEQLQNDTLSLPARSLVPLLNGLPMPNEADRAAQQTLLHWNDRLEPDSEAAGIYEMWQRQLVRDVRPVAIPAGVAINPSMTRIVEWLHAPDGRFGADPVAGRDALLVKSFDEAVTALGARLGPDPTHWQLGAYHHALIISPIAAALGAAGERFNVGDAPRGGDAYTVNATGGGDNQTAGGSFKIVADSGDWDGSVGLNNPGQSGDVNSPHYRDLYPLWARGEYFPIFYSRAKVESVTESETKLVPR